MMKPAPVQPTATESATKPALSRRAVFGGAATVGALAAVAAVMPRQELAASATAAADAQAESGYRLTEHIQRYYQTARV